MDGGTLPPVRLEGPLPDPPRGTRSPADPPRDALQWIGFLGAPLIWSVAFFVSYALVPTICHRGGVWILQVIPVTGFLLILGAGALSRRNWTRLAGQEKDPEGQIERARFMALAGMVLSVGFGVIMAAQLIPTLAIDPCR
jgi:hypothetical protein